MYQDDLFEWDDSKNIENIIKHGISFSEAQTVFTDPKVIITSDLVHSEAEERYFAFGRISGGICTVRFTFRGRRIRIFGAGYWRRGKKYYEKNNKTI